MRLGDSVKCHASPNIAVIKALRTTTTVTFSDGAEDTFRLNGTDQEGEGGVPKFVSDCRWYGQQCKLYGVTEFATVCCITRQGSGSACRSLLGGFVHWAKGHQADGSDSLVSQVAGASHWRSLHVLCLVSRDAAKETSSTAAMQLSVQKCPQQMEARLAEIPSRVRAASEAIRANPPYAIHGLCLSIIQSALLILALASAFAPFAKIAMEESDSLREICVATGIDYWTPISHFIVRLVRWFNEAHEETCAAYSFDAGPNAFIFVEDTHVRSFLHTVLHYLPTLPEKWEFQSTDLHKWLVNTSVEALLPALQAKDTFSATISDPLGSLAGIFQSRVGEGPSFDADEI
eukprot:gene1622-2851_t